MESCCWVGQGWGGERQGNPCSITRMEALKIPGEGNKTPAEPLCTRNTGSQHPIPSSPWEVLRIPLTALFHQLPASPQDSSLLGSEENLPGETAGNRNRAMPSPQEQPQLPSSPIILQLNFNFTGTPVGLEIILLGNSHKSLPS